MADVRLTATNPEDSSVVPVACDASGRLLLQELPPAFDGTVDGDLTVTGKGTFAAGKSIIGNDGSAQFAQGAVDIYANGKVEFTQDVTFDGSAEFAGVIDALYFESVRDSSAQTCFAAYLAPDTSNSTFKVTADGSATFAGDVTIGPYSDLPYTQGIRSLVDNGGVSAIVINGDGENKTAIGIYNGLTRSYICKLFHDGHVQFAGNKAGFTSEGYLWCTTRRGDTVILDATSNGLASWVEYTPTTRFDDIRDGLNAIRGDGPEMPTDTP